MSTYAVLQGNVECIKKLLECKANPNSEDKQGLTPLHYASTAHNLPAIKILCQFKANINHNRSGSIFIDLKCNYYYFLNGIDTPLGKCAATESTNRLIECMKYLLENGADPNIGTPFLPIHSILYFFPPFFFVIF